MANSPSVPSPTPGAAPAPARPARRSGVVVPHRAAWHQRLAARLIWLMIRSLSATVRLRIVQPAGYLPQDGCAPVIFCVWHNRLALSLVVYEIIVRGADPQRHLAALVSASRDGGLLARVLELFGVEPVRGSSSRRGAQALLELTTLGQKGLDLAITPDGPRGPCYRVQEGVIAVAQLTGLAIVPVVINYSRKVTFKSWDRFQVPLPFARGDIFLGEPIMVPRDASEAAREAIRQQIQAHLQAGTRD